MSQFDRFFDDATMLRSAKRLQELARMRFINEYAYTLYDDKNITGDSIEGHENMSERSLAKKVLKEQYRIRSERAAFIQTYSNPSTQLPNELQNAFNEFLKSEQNAITPGDAEEYKAAVVRKLGDNIIAINNNKIKEKKTVFDNISEQKQSVAAKNSTPLLKTLSNIFSSTTQTIESGEELMGKAIDINIKFARSLNPKLPGLDLTGSKTARDKIMSDGKFKAYDFETMGDYITEFGFADFGIDFSKTGEDRVLFDEKKNMVDGVMGFTPDASKNIAKLVAQYKSNPQSIPEDQMYIIKRMMQYGHSSTVLANAGMPGAYKVNSFASEQEINMSNFGDLDAGFRSLSRIGGDQNKAENLVDFNYQGKNYKVTSPVKMLLEQVAISQNDGIVLAGFNNKHFDSSHLGKMFAALGDETGNPASVAGYNAWMQITGGSMSQVMQLDAIQVARQLTTNSSIAQRSDISRMLAGKDETLNTVTGISIKSGADKAMAKRFGDSMQHTAAWDTITEGMSIIMSDFLWPDSTGNDPFSIAPMEHDAKVGSLFFVSNGYGLTSDNSILMMKDAQSGAVKTNTGYRITDTGELVEDSGYIGPKKNTLVAITGLKQLDLNSTEFNKIHQQLPDANINDMVAVELSTVKPIEGITGFRSKEAYKYDSPRTIIMTKEGLREYIGRNFDYAGDFKFDKIGESYNRLNGENSWNKLTEHQKALAAADGFGEWEFVNTQDMSSTEKYALAPKEGAFDWNYLAKISGSTNANDTAANAIRRNGYSFMNKTIKALDAVETEVTKVKEQMVADGQVAQGEMEIFNRALDNLMHDSKRNENGVLTNIFKFKYDNTVNPNGNGIDNFYNSYRYLKSMEGIYKKTIDTVNTAAIPPAARNQAVNKVFNNIVSTVVAQSGLDPTSDRVKLATLNKDANKFYVDITGMVSDKKRHNNFDVTAPTERYQVAIDLDHVNYTSDIQRITGIQDSRKAAYEFLAHVYSSYSVSSQRKIPTNETSEWYMARAGEILGNIRNAHPDAGAPVAPATQINTRISSAIGDAFNSLGLKDEDFGVDHYFDITRGDNLSNISEIITNSIYSDVDSPDKIIEQYGLTGESAERLKRDFAARKNAAKNIATSLLTYSHNAKLNVRYDNSTKHFFVGSGENEEFDLTRALPIPGFNHKTMSYYDRFNGQTVATTNGFYRLNPSIDARVSNSIARYKTLTYGPLLGDYANKLEHSVNITNYNRTTSEAINNLNFIVKKSIENITKKAVTRADREDARLGREIDIGEFVDAIPDLVNAGVYSADDFSDPEATQAFFDRVSKYTRRHPNQRYQMDMEELKFFYSDYRSWFKPFAVDNTMSSTAYSTLFGDNFDYDSMHSVMSNIYYHANSTVKLDSNKRALLSLDNDGVVPFTDISPGTRGIGSVLNRAHDIDTSKYNIDNEGVEAINFGGEILSEREAALRSKELLSARSIGIKQLNISTQSLQEILSQKKSEISSANYDLLYKYLDESASISDPMLLLGMRRSTKQIIKTDKFATTEQLLYNIKKDKDTLLELDEARRRDTAFLIEFVNGQVAFKYNYGMRVTAGDTIGFASDYSGGIGRVTTNTSGVLNMEYVDQYDRRKIINESEINTLLNTPENINTISHAVSNGSTDVEKKLFASLAAQSIIEQQMGVSAKYVVSDYDLSPYRKIALSTEKSVSRFVANGVGSINPKIKSVFKKLGLQDLIGSNLDYSFLDNSEAFENLVRSSGKYDADVNKILKKKGFSNFEEFRTAFFKEQRSAWNDLVSVLRGTGLLKDDETVSNVGNILHETVKSSHGQNELAAELNSLISTIYAKESQGTSPDKAAEATVGILSDAFGDGSLTTGPNGSIVVNNGYYIKYANKLKELESKYGPELRESNVELYGNKIHGVIQDTRLQSLADSDASTMFKKEGENGIKVTRRMLTVLGINKYDEKVLNSLFQDYGKLYGDDANVEFFKRFGDIASISGNGKVILREGVAGRAVNESLISNLSEEIFSGNYTDNPAFAYNKNNELTYSKEARRIVSSHGIDSKEANAIRDAMVADPSGFGKIASVDEILKFHSWQKNVAANNFNKSLQKGISEDSQIEEAKQLEAQGFEIIKATDLNVANKDYKLFLNNLYDKSVIVDFGEMDSVMNGLRSKDGARFLAFGAIHPTEFDGEFDSNLAASGKLAGQIRKLVGTVNSYDRSSNKEVAGATVRDAFDETVDAIGRAASSKEGYFAELTSTRLAQSAMMKSDMISIYQTKNPVLSRAMFNGKTIAERAEKGLGTTAIFVGKNFADSLITSGDISKIFDAAELAKFKKDAYETLRTEGTVGLGLRQPMEYTNSAFSSRIYLDDTIASDQIAITESMAKAIKSDMDGDLNGVAAIMGRANVELNGKMKSVRLNSLQYEMLRNKGMSVEWQDPDLMRNLERASEIISSGPLRKIQDYITEIEAARQAGDYSKLSSGAEKYRQSASGMSLAEEVLKMQGLASEKIQIGNTILSASWFDSGDRAQKAISRMEDIEASDEWKNIAGDRKYAGNVSEFMSIAEEFIKTSNNQQENIAALSHRGIEMRQQMLNNAQIMRGRAGIINNDTRRFKDIVDILSKRDGYKNGQAGTERIYAFIEHLNDMSQVAKNTADYAEPSEIRDVFVDFLGVNGTRDNSRMFELIDRLDFSKDLKRRSAMYGGLNENVSDEEALNYARAMLKNDMANLLPEGMVVNPAAFKAASYGYSMSPTDDAVIIKGNEDNVSNIFMRMANEASAKLGYGKTFREEDILIRGNDKNIEMDYSEPIEDFRAEAEEAFKQREQAPSISMTIEHSFKSLKNAFKGKTSMAMLGFAGAVMGAGYAGGNPTIPADGQAQGIQQQNASYEIPDMMSSYNTQGVNHQAPGYVINVNANTDQGREFAQKAVSQAFTNNIPRGNINMTMNIKDSSSNIQPGDIVQYISNMI